jgi:hypothetical protein
MQKATVSTLDRDRGQHLCKRMNKEPLYPCLDDMLPLGSLMGGLDDLYWQTKMAEIARSYSQDPDRAWQEATVAARQYMTEGYTTQLFAWVLPTPLADGIDGVLGEVERLCGLQPRSLDDVDRTGAISPFIWWHDGECGGLEEIWSANQWLAGVQVKPFSRFWVALKRGQARLLQQLGGV